MLSNEFLLSINKLAELEPRVNGLAEALTGTSPSVSIRLNKRKSTERLLTHELTYKLTHEPTDEHTHEPCVPTSFPPHVPCYMLHATCSVPWCPEGYYLSERPRFTLDPALHQGLYYVQDASSMFISHVIRSLTRNCKDPLAYLDACAAPGGKTTAAIDALPHGSMVVANEWDYKRAEILVENVMKWGYPAVAVSRGDTARFGKLKNTFDIIAADVPCSGEGMMRKDSVAVDQWSPALVRECVGRQREIVDNLWPALKPGGFLIYSTCTFNRQENEEIVEYIMQEYDAEPVVIDIDGFDGVLGGIGTQLPCYRFMPHRVMGEGLFMAVLRKGGECSLEKSNVRDRDKKGNKQSVTVPQWMPPSLVPLVRDDVLWGIEPQWKALVDRLMKSVDLIMPGVKVATIKGKDLIPEQAVALSTALVVNEVVTCEVDRDTALNYLCREAVSIPDGLPRGYVLLTYDSIPLGWVKNLGNRTNNLYPASWRILHK